MISESWTVEVQEAIRSTLPDHLAAHPEYVAIGLWSGEVLVAIATGEPDLRDPTVWWSNLVAVRIGHHRKGYGRRVKEELIGIALANGVQVVVSRVAFDNDPMIAVNRSLGAVVEVEQPLSKYVICTITI